jgi:hypothetical protein
MCNNKAEKNPPRNPWSAENVLLLEDSVQPHQLLYQNRESPRCVSYTKHGLRSQHVFTTNKYELMLSLQP